VLGFEPMTYGSESECAIHYTTAPHEAEADRKHGVSMRCLVTEFIGVRRILKHRYHYNYGERFLLSEEQ